MRAARVGLPAVSRVVPTARGPVVLAEEGDGPPVLVRGTAGGFAQMGAAGDQGP